MHLEITTKFPQHKFHGLQRDCNILQGKKEKKKRKKVAVKRSSVVRITRTGLKLNQ